MPELAEVHYFFRQWDPGRGERVVKVRLHAGKRIFRDADTEALAKQLEGSVLKAGETRGKQMLFSFSGGGLPWDCRGWLGLHLGMTGKLYAEPLPFAGDAHDHLVLETGQRSLVYRDPRLFGKVLFETGREAPEYWRLLPPEVLSREFSRERMENFLRRRAKSPVKAVLLDQRVFPGVGNWMADEMLWQAGIHPAAPAGHLDDETCRRLYLAVRHVCRVAMKTVGVDYRDPPESWLFAHRWKDGGTCPRGGGPLVRETIGGRTTCYAPERQRLPG